MYQATVINTISKEEQTFVGLTENTLKTRYNNHTSSFRNKTKKNSTELSKYVWKSKEADMPHTKLENPQKVPTVLEPN